MQTTISLRISVIKIVYICNFISHIFDNCCCCSVTVVSNSLWHHRLQHARPPCSSPSPEVCPSSCPLHHNAIHRIIAWHPLLQPLFVFPNIRDFSTVSAVTSYDQNTGVSASASVLRVNIQGWSPLRLTGLISLLSKGRSGVFSSTTVRINSLPFCLLYNPVLTTIRDNMIY